MPATLPISYTSVEKVKVTLSFINSVSTVTSAVIAEFIGREEAKINTRLSARYALPFTTDIPILTAIASDLSAYALLSRHSFLSQTTKDNPWPERYREAMDELELITAGKVDLVTSSGDIVSIAGRMLPTSNRSQYYPTMTERGGVYDAVDPDRITDLDQERS